MFPNKKDMSVSLEGRRVKIFIWIFFNFKRLNYEVMSQC